MFRQDLAISALFTRVGWQQPTQSDYAILTGDNLVSGSGMYFTDYHKAVTVKNIKDTQEDADISNANFNLLLERMQKAAIIRVLQGVFNRDVIIENLQLYTRENLMYSQQITSSDKFCGIRVRVANDSSYAVRLNSMSLLFSGAGTFNMYCYHSVKGKIWTKSVTTVAGKETIVNVSDLIMSISELAHKAGEYYIGYFQADITGEAINYDHAIYATPSIFGISGFEADKTASEVYDVDSYVENNLNYGINLELTSVRDFTQVITRNPSMFDEAVGLQMAVDAVELMINSTRSNATERLTKDQLTQLYNDLNLATGSDQMPYSAGLKTRLTREIQRLNRNFFPNDKPTLVQC